MGGYASVEELADALASRDSGIGLKRLRSIWQTGESRAVDRREIAAACNVPIEFMEHGFADASWGVAESDPLAEIRSSITSLAADTLQLRQELQALRGRDRQGGRPGDEP